MFNGLIKSTGTIKNIKKKEKSMYITVMSNINIKKYDRDFYFMQRSLPNTNVKKK